MEVPADRLWTWDEQGCPELGMVMYYSTLELRMGSRRWQEVLLPIYYSTVYAILESSGLGVSNYTHDLEQLFQVLSWWRDWGGDHGWAAVQEYRRTRPRTLPPSVPGLAARGWADARYYLAGHAEGLAVLVSHLKYLVEDQGPWHDDAPLLAGRGVVLGIIAMLIDGIHILRRPPVEPASVLPEELHEVREVIGSGVAALEAARAVAAMPRSPDGAPGTPPHPNEGEPRGSGD